MTITLDLSPEAEAALKESAARAGLPLEQYLLECVSQRSATSDGVSTSPAVIPPTQDLAELLADWQAEDATDDPEELRQAEEELEELKARLNSNRAATGEASVFSEDELSR